MSHSKKIHLVALGCVIAALAGCSSNTVDADNADITPVKSAKAKFNYETGSIDLPLDEYDFLENKEIQKNINLAEYTVNKKCMESKGFKYNPKEIIDNDRYVDERSYGLWNVDHAQRYGFGLKNDEKSTPGESAKWDEAYDQCSEENAEKLASLAPTQEEMEDSLASRLANDAYNLATRNPGWAKARNEWWACLEKQGLTPRKEGSAWTSKEGLAAVEKQQPDGSSPVKEREIQVATIEATCNHDTQMAQKLGDLEASYQQALINRNQAALNDLKASYQEYVRKAKEIIEQNG